MPEKIKEITRQDVHNLVGSEIFLRGEEYFEDELVKSLELIEEKTLVGEVEGNNTYHVSIKIDEDGEIVCNCSCPCDFTCKHSVALLLAFLDSAQSSKKNKQGKKEEAKTEKPAQTIKDILKDKSKEELALIIERFIGQYPELSSLIKLDSAKIVSKIRSLFSRYWDWNEMSDLTHELYIVLEGIQNNKQRWNKELFESMEKCSEIMMKGYQDTHDEGDLSDFLEEWFEAYGQIFSSLNPSFDEKKIFIEKLEKLIEKDEYSLEGSIEKAFIGMCKNKEDIELVKNMLEGLKLRQKEEDYYGDFDELYLELYEKIGDNDGYFKLAKTSGFNEEIVKKLISLGKLNEALAECEIAIKEDVEYVERFLVLRIDLLKKLRRKKEFKEALFDYVLDRADFDYFLKLKKESSKEEWKNILGKIIEDSKKKNRSVYLARIYYEEADYKNSYDYSKNSTDTGFLELLSRKLSKNYSELAIDLLQKLIFQHINYGSGWPYKKAGKLLGEIKKIDKEGILFRQIKKSIIAKHKKKYSLMTIIEKI
jgi:hypothetical protein